MNALFVLRPAKLWAFNIGHPCPSLAKGELNVIVLRSNFQQTSNQSRTIPQKSATLSKGGTIRLHFRPPLTPLKPISIFLKGKFEAALSRKGGTIPLHFRPPSTQLKPISIFLKGEFEAAHSRKVGTVSGDPPQNLHSTIAKLRPFLYPAKIRNIIKGRNLLRPTGAYSWSAKL